MRRTYWYAGLAELSQAMTEDAAQRSRWTFYEVVMISFKQFQAVSEYSKPWQSVILCFSWSMIPSMILVVLGACRKPPLIHREEHERRKRFQMIASLAMTLCMSMY